MATSVPTRSEQCHCRFISYNECATMMGDVGNKEAVHVWGQKIDRKIFVPSS